MNLPFPPTDWTRHPLHIAALIGSANDAERLLAQGVDVNENTVLEGTPLHVATRHGHLKVAQLLLANRANVHAERHGQWGEFAGQPIHDVAATSHIDLAGLLLDYGADINSKERCHRTPLHRAVSAGNVLMVDFLTSKGADVNAVADWDPDPRTSYVMCRDRNMTPLHVAAIGGYTDIARQLVAAGAAKDVRVGTTDDYYEELQGLTALDLARRFRQQMAKRCDELLDLLGSEESPDSFSQGPHH